MRLSIITTVLNGQDTIRKTVEGVKTLFNNASFEWEHIIVEGVHKEGDQTTKILNEFPHLVRITQDKNDGIYSGMNVGILKAKGEYVIMINSGDLPTKEVIELLEQDLSPETVYHGYCEQVTPEYKRIAISKKPKWLMRYPIRMPLFHQSAIIPKSFHNKYGLYSLEYKYASDFEYICRLIYKKVQFNNTNSVLSIMPSGGLSDRWSTLFKRAEECFRIRRKYLGLMPAVIISAYKFISETSRRILSALLN